MTSAMFDENYKIIIIIKTFGIATNKLGHSAFLNTDLWFN
jgi:hypothetical protein